jgi:hypothetical protein
MKSAILVLLFVSLGSSLAHADLVYKWTDDKGRVYYSDAPPPGRPSTVVEIDVREPTDADRKAAADRAARDKASLQSPVASAPVSAGQGTTPAASQPLPGDQTACRAAWKAYLDSVDCFAPYTNVNGSVRPEAFQLCKSVQQPREPCKR